MILQDKYFGDNLRRLRIEHKFSQEKLVLAMAEKYSMMSRSTYAKIELGMRNIKVTDLVILKHLYQVEYDEFFKGIEVNE